MQFCYNESMMILKIKIIAVQFIHNFTTKIHLFKTPKWILDTFEQ